MDNEWRQKYFKYKIKYNELKKLIGAASQNNTISTPTEINSIIVTHNGRLRCLLDHFKKGLGSIKFQNCAILKLVVSMNKCDLSLVYSGSLASNTENDKSTKTVNSIGVSDKDKDKYYVTPGTQTNKQSEEFITISNMETLKLLNVKSVDLGDKTYNFYLIRHGDGKHNQAKAEGKKGIFGPDLTDAELTLAGIKQAENAGQEFKKMLGENTKIDHLFASDLKRTRQTLEEVLRQGIQLTNPNLDIFILPCSHELDYHKTNCDGNQPTSFFSAENKMNCPSNNNSNDGTNDYCSSIIKYKYTENNGIKHTENEGVLYLNWKYYKLFYDNSSRTPEKKSIFNIINTEKSIRFHCRETSMLSLALFIINNPNCNDRQIMEKWINERK